MTIEDVYECKRYSFLAKFKLKDYNTVKPIKLQFHYENINPLEIAITTSKSDGTIAFDSVNADQVHVFKPAVKYTNYNRKFDNFNDLKIKIKHLGTEIIFYVNDEMHSQVKSLTRKPLTCEKFVLLYPDGINVAHGDIPVTLHKLMTNNELFVFLVLGYVLIFILGLFIVYILPGGAYKLMKKIHKK